MPTAAFATITSSPPKPATAVSTMPCTSARRRTSPTHARPSDPVSRTSASVSSSPTGSTSLATTFAPAAASATAIPRPIPEPAPVTAATVPSSLTRAS